MGSLFPTRREIALLTFLLFTLFFIFRKHDWENHHTDLRRFSLQTNQTLHAASTHDLSLISPSEWNTKLRWGASGVVPQTKLLAHVPGWSILDRLYLHKGTLYIVSDQPENMPETRYIISRGVYIRNGKAAEKSRLPTGVEIQVVSTQRAKEVLGVEAHLIGGNTFLVNDPPQFITHYYHWAAELWFGFWRTYSSLDSLITDQGNTTLPPIDRIMFRHLDATHWRDYASLNQWIIRSNFPSIAMEFIDDWRERAELGATYVLDRVVLADRSGAMQSFNFARYQRSASAAFSLPGSASWWLTMRNNVIQYAGLSAAAGEGTTKRPVITYISRQEWGRRMLIKEDHDRLVNELYKLRDNYGYEVNIVAAEKMSRVEQLRLAARTTIMMGVHGNGLTSLLWMNPTPRSTVIEFFFPGGFAHDYEYTARAMGMTHYGFWGSDYFTSPHTPLPTYVPGFQGNSIPIDGEAVARLCVERLSLNLEVDD